MCSTVEPRIFNGILISLKNALDSVAFRRKNVAVEGEAVANALKLGHLASKAVDRKLVVFVVVLKDREHSVYGLYVLVSSLSVHIKVVQRLLTRRISI